MVKGDVSSGEIYGGGGGGGLWNFRHTNLEKLN